MPHSAISFSRQASRLRQSIELTTSLLDEGLSLYRRHFRRILLIAVAYFLLNVFGFLYVAVNPISFWGDGLLFLIMLFVYSLISVHLLEMTARTVGSSTETKLGSFWSSIQIIKLSLIFIFYVLLSSLIGFVFWYIHNHFSYYHIIMLGGLFVDFWDTFWFFYDISFVCCLIALGAIPLYAVQGWFNKEISLRHFLKHHLVFFRRINKIFLLSWFCISLFEAAMLVVTTLSIAVLYGMLYLLFGLVVLEDSIPIIDLLFTLILIVSLSAILAPILMWMTLLYQHNRIAYDGTDLEARIQKSWDVMPRNDM